MNITSPFHLLGSNPLALLVTVKSNPPLDQWPIIAIYCRVTRARTRSPAISSSFHRSEQEFHRVFACSRPTQVYLKSLSCNCFMEKELAVYINGRPVYLQIGSKTVVWDLACQLEEMNYPVNVAYPEVTEDGKGVSGETAVKSCCKYCFRKCASNLARLFACILATILHPYQLVSSPATRTVCLYLYQNNYNIMLCLLQGLKTPRRLALSHPRQKRQL